MQFLVEFRANWAIRVICVLWFSSMVLLGGAGEMFAKGAQFAWDVLVPPARIHAILHPAKPVMPPPVVRVIDSTGTSGETEAETRARKAGWGAGQELPGGVHADLGTGATP